MNNPNFSAERSNIAKQMLLIVALFFLAGTAFRVTLVEETRLQSHLSADAVQYFFYAYNLSNNGTYTHSNQNYAQAEQNQLAPLTPDADRPPLFSLLASHWIKDGTATEITSVLYLNVWLQCGGLLLFSLLLIHLWRSYWTVIPLFFIWFNPHIANMVVYFLTESLFLALITSCLFFIWVYEKQARIVYLFIAGLCIGLASMTRGTMAYFWLFVVFSLLLFRSFNKQQLLYFLIPCLVPPLLWKLRNFLVVNDDENLRIIATLYHGSFPDFMYNNQPETYGYPYRVDPMQGYAMESLSNTLHLIWERAVENPSLYLKWYLFGKLQAFWQWSTIQGTEQIFIYQAVASPYFSRTLYTTTAFIHYIVHYPIVIAGLLGTCLAQFKLITKQLSAFSVIGFSSIILLYICLLHMAAAPFPRYSIPFKPLIILMAGYLIIELYRGLSNKIP